MFTNNYPYTDFHELNLDAMVSDLSTLEGDVSELEERVTTLEESGGTGITVDTAMSSTSTNPVQNKVVYAAIEAVTLTVDTAMSSTSTNPVQNKAVYQAIEDAKSDVYSNFDSDQIANASTVNGDTVTEALQYLNANKAGKAVATTSTAGLMSATDKTNLDLVVADYTAALDAIG